MAKQVSEAPADEEETPMNKNQSDGSMNISRYINRNKTVPPSMLLPDITDRQQLNAVESPSEVEMLDDTDLIDATISMTDTLPLEQPTRGFESKVSFSFQPFSNNVQVYGRKDVRSIVNAN